MYKMTKSAGVYQTEDNFVCWREIQWRGEDSTGSNLWLYLQPLTLLRIYCSHKDFVGVRGTERVNKSPLWTIENDLLLQPDNNFNS